MKKHAKSIIFTFFVMIAVIFCASYPLKEGSKVAAATLEDVKISLTAGNSWESNGDKYVQVNVLLTNNGSSEVQGWTVKLPLDANAKVSSSWNVQQELKKGILTMTGMDSTKSISSGDKISFGIILVNAGNIDFDKAKLSLAGAGTPEPTKTPSTEASAKPEENTPISIPEPSTDDWLSTDGSKIVDINGKEVWLTGVNWFGYNTGTNIFDGVWSCDLNSMIKTIADRGFNLIRVPFSSELILNWKSGVYPKANYNDYVNKYLIGMNSLQIFDYVIAQCRANGIKIMIDIHSAETNAAGHFAPLWYTAKISEADYLASLSWMADRYKNDDTIIAYDLKNEPHGAVGDTTRAIWNDSTDANNWKNTAEKASIAVLSKNPNALVMVEGIQIYPKDISSNGNYASKNKNDYYNTWWGGNLRGVKDYPVNLGKYQNKLVYSPHDYGPSVSDQPWFSAGYTQESLYKDCWKDNWMFIQEENIAPLLIGEWGGFMTSPNIKWMTCLRNFIIKNKINHTFWCLNANSGDTGGLLNSDFTTWDEEKYNFVKEALWQKGGKFVGLDHRIPLGTKGLSLGQY